MIKKFINFIKETYLESNKATLYHFTSLDSFLNIIENNKIKVGEYDNPFKGKNIKFVSLTRKSKLDLTHYKIDIDIRLELDKNELSKRYKIIPYDYFINKNKEEYPKSSINRKQPFEFEEIILEDIINIDRYIISINFMKYSIYNRDIIRLIPVLREKGIKIYYNYEEYR